MGYSQSLERADFYLPDVIEDIVNTMSKDIEVYYRFGHWIEIANILQELGQHRNYENTKFPLFYIPVGHKTNILDATLNEVTFSLYIISGSEIKYSSKERLDHIMKTVLMPIYNLWKIKLIDNVWFRTKNYIEIPHDEEKLYYLGAKDSNQNRLNQVCDAIYLNYNNIKINKL